MARRRGKYIYREVFFAHNGPGPYVCFDCGQEVTFDEVLVHHKDHDDTNDDPCNLVAAHDGCHTSHHMRGWNKDPEKVRSVGAAVAKSNRARVITDVLREKMRTSHQKAWAPGGARYETERRKKEAAGVR